MELKEDKISLAAIKQYVLYLKDCMGGGLEELEFRTIKGWLFYSLLLAVTISIPCAIVLLITGLFSGGMAIDLLVYISVIPLMFVLPTILLYTFLCNYRKPKQRRKQLLQFLNRYDWDGPIRQMSQSGFECMKNKYIFRTDIRKLLDEKLQVKWLFTMIIPFYLPVGEDEQDDYLKSIDTYLDGKSLFLLHPEMAYFSVPVKVFPKLNIHKDIEQLLYIMDRFRLLPSTFYSRGDIFKKVPNTLEILVLFTFGQPVDQRCLDWATSMLEADFVNERMQHFQQQTLQPDNQIELKEQLKMLLLEFNLSTFSKKHMLSNYVRFLLSKERQGERSSLQIIQCLSDLYLSSESPELKNFNLLYKAKIALDQTGKQDSWTDTKLSVDNADLYIVSYLDIWKMLNE